jgi:hypothetical protein
MEVRWLKWNKDVAKIQVADTSLRDVMECTVLHKNKNENI